MRWILQQRLTGASAAGIARTLNDRGVPSFAAYDPARNRHRTGTAWTVRTVAAILANARYTGRQVWNRQRIDHHETVPGDKRSNSGPTRAWNPKSEWAVSTELAHPAIVSDGDFLTAQGITAISAPADEKTRVYALTWLLLCAVCGRRLEGHWVYGNTATDAGTATPAPTHPETNHAGSTGPRTPQQLADQGVLPHQADTTDMVAYLAKRGTVIICDTATVTIDDPTGPEVDASTDTVKPIPRQRTGEPPAAATGRRSLGGEREDPRHSHPKRIALAGVDVSEAQHSRRTHGDHCESVGPQVVGLRLLRLSLIHARLISSRGRESPSREHPEGCRS